MTSDDDYPDYEKVSRHVLLDKPLDDYLRETSGNVSGTMRRFLWDSLGDEIPQNGPERMAPNIRRRVLRIQREALRKEIHELEMMLQSIEDTLEKMEDRPEEVWKRNIARAIKAHAHPMNSMSELLEASDSGMEDENDDTGK